MKFLYKENKTSLYNFVTYHWCHIGVVWVGGGGRPAAAGAGVAAGHAAGQISVQGGVETVVGGRAGRGVALIMWLLDSDIVMLAGQLKSRRKAQGLGPVAQTAHHGEWVLRWPLLRNELRGPFGPRIEIRGGDLNARRVRTVWDQKSDWLATAGWAGPRPSLIICSPSCLLSLRSPLFSLSLSSCGLAFFSFAFPVCAFFYSPADGVVVVLGKSNLQPICASPDLVGLGLCAEVRRRASGHHLHATGFSPWSLSPREKGYCVHDLCGPVPEINNAHAAADGLSLSVFVFKWCPSIVIDLFMSGYWNRTWWVRDRSSRLQLQIRLQHIETQ